MVDVESTWAMEKKKESGDAIRGKDVMKKAYK